VERLPPGNCNEWESPRKRPLNGESQRFQEKGTLNGGLSSVVSKKLLNLRKAKVPQGNNFSESGHTQSGTFQIREKQLLVWNPTQGNESPNQLLTHVGITLTFGL